MPAVQSKLVRPVAKSSITVNAARNTRASRDDGKENEPVRASRHHRSTQSQVKDHDDNDEEDNAAYAPGDKDDNNEDNDTEYVQAAAAQDDDEDMPGLRSESDSEDDDEQPVRSTRVRRASAKQAQHLEDEEEAQARKIAKASKAAKKQRQQQEDPEPLEDTVFTSREVQLPTKKPKVLQQRDSRVPSIQPRAAAIEQAAAASRTQRGRTHEPSQDLRYIIARQDLTPSTSRHGVPHTSSPRRSGHGLTSHTFNNWQESFVAPGPVIGAEAPRPRSINGNVLPERLHLNLHHHTSDNQQHEPDLDHSRSSRPAHRLGRHGPDEHQSDIQPRRSRPALPRRLSSSHSRSRSPAQQPRHSRPVQRHQLSPSRSRSSSPITGNKRARSPADDLRETQAQKLNDHQGRSRAKDYDDITQELVSIANTWFRCLLATTDPFAEHLTEQEILTLSWGKVCKELKVNMRMTPDIAKMILRRGSQMRGELKTKVRALVEIVFGFESGQNKKHVHKNRQIAEELKDGLGFCYNENPTSVAERKGLYKAKIIQKSVNVMWFNNRRDEGTTHPEVFGPVFPKPAFALVLTAIECAIDEWATGIRTEVPFTAADYRSVYEEHLKCLNDFEKQTKDRSADIMGNILTRIHNIGRHHSGAQPIGPVVSTSALSRAAIDAALLEFQEDEETESDGENGERSD
ncbi:hypothetical protein C8F04DRAFT_1310968 [Mycena alexandri]|uniref:DUF6532 domain-containing protein n=1 Tax=Mycena alexandri TaxID=1745969 RepID=A0AAD6TA05_9AGAR|nr:hypothetical protein C8F04DRAFT_1310968 [Mycena alexandri]